MARGQAVRQVDQPASAVWQVVADHRGMATWAPRMSVEMERAGEPTWGGVGAIRAISGPALKIREQITGFEPDRRLAYRALSGVPLPDYAGEVELAEHDGATTIRWSLTAKTALPGTDLLLGLIARVMLSALVRAVRRTA